MAGNPQLENYLINKAVTQQIQVDNYVVYNRIKAKPIAAYRTTVTDAIVYILKEWKLPEVRKREAFI